MFRCLPFLAAMTLVLPTVAAPRLKDQPAQSYYPLAVGTRWVTEFKYPTSTVETTEVVTAVEKKDGATVVSVGREVAGKVGTELSQMRVTDKGLFRMSSLGTVFTEPYCVLQLPLKPGVAWTAEANRGGVTPTKYHYKAVKEEDVEVPAGNFKAFRIEVEYESAGATQRSTIWYAERVGVVKQEHKDKDSGYVKVLKSFTSGK